VKAFKVAIPIDQGSKSECFWDGEKEDGWEECPYCGLLMSIQFGNVNAGVVAVIDDDLINGATKHIQLSKE